MKCSVRFIQLLTVALFSQAVTAADRLAACDVLTGGLLLEQRQLLVAGTRGQLLIKDLSVTDDSCGLQADNGWRQAASEVAGPSGRWTGLKAVAQQPWLLGHQQTLYYYDNADAWQRVYQAADSDFALMDVAQAPRLGRYFAVGTRGVYLVSEDQGKHWAPQDLYIDPEWDEPEDYNLNGIAVLAKRGLLVAGEAGALYWSKDGDRWHKDHAGYDGTWFGAQALADGGVVAYGFAGHVAYSEGYREDWTVVKGPQRASLFAAHRLADGSMLLAGERGALWRWTPQTDVFVVIASGTQATITDLLVLDNQEQQQILLITDQGVKRVAYPLGS